MTDAFEAILGPHRRIEFEKNVQGTNALKLNMAYGTPSLGMSRTPLKKVKITI
jgi:hypothetical protein